MRVLVCPQEFKGSLTAQQATRALAAGVRHALPDAEVVEAAMADGGPGTVDIVCEAAGGELVRGRFHGPLGEPVEAAYGLLPDGLAVIEAATTAGLVLVPEQRRDPARASTHGVGEQIVDALRRGARRVIVGVGGTGTNDGGAGAAQAVGCRLLGHSGVLLSPGVLELARLARIDARGVERALRPAGGGVEVRVAVDVTNRLLGLEGATAVYGPQKGVRPALAPQLEAALARWAELCERDLGVAIMELDGGGAGGGLAAGLAAACGATIESGAALVGEAIGLPRQIAGADLIVTGEGSLDAQTAYGKTVAHVVSLARDAGRPCLAVAGWMDRTPDGIVDAEPSAAGLELAEAMARAAELAEQAAGRLIRRYLEREGG